MIKGKKKKLLLFKKGFLSNVRNVLFGIIYNPFEQENLTKISNTNVTFINTIFKDLSNLIDPGEQRFHIFWHERLMAGEVPLNKPIQKNRKYKDKKKLRTKKKLVYSNDIRNKSRTVAKERKQGTLHLIEI